MIKAKAASLELEWLVKNDINVFGYNLIYWSESGLSTSIKLGKINSVRIDTLSEGKSYWFQIIPYGMNGEKGTESNIIYYKVPLPHYVEPREKPMLKIKQINK